MSSPSSSAAEALRALGRRLREIRVEAGLTGRSLGLRAGWHSSKISRIEHGKQTPTVADIRTWCGSCGAADQALELVTSLHAAESMFVQWRRMDRAGLKAAQTSVLPLWERTRRFRIYSGMVIPGPVQTAGYITAVLTSVRDRRRITEDITDAVAVRTAKQHVINDPTRRFAIVVEESILRARVGSHDTMAAQLGHLLVVGSLPNLSLGVIPLDADRSHTRPVEGFWMFDDQHVTVELVSGHLTITQASEIAMYADTFTDLAELAVHGAKARSLITAALTTLTNRRNAQA